MVTVLAAMVLFNPVNTLTPTEVRAGWQLLFDGQTTKGWHNFRSTGVRPGWKVVDGALMVADPGNAGDIVTDETYGWFELSIDVKIGKGQNSGIIFHAADSGDAMWHSGPELQIFDDQGAPGQQKTGWLYELYGSPVDALKPIGEWNTIRLVVTKEKGTTYVNGTKYYDFVLDSEDFLARVAKSKFGSMPNFAKVHRGSIGLQGDHGIVSFQNIKIRPIK